MSSATFVTYLNGIYWIFSLLYQKNQTENHLLLYFLVYSVLFPPSTQNHWQHTTAVRETTRHDNTLTVLSYEHVKQEQLFQDIKNIPSKLKGLGLRVMVFNTTFNNISVILWQLVLLVEETGVPENNHSGTDLQQVTDKLFNIMLSKLRTC